MADERRFPYGEDLVRHWRRTGNAGFGYIDVAGSDERLRVTWSGFEHDDASTLGRQYLGVFSWRGKKLRVREEYLHTSAARSTTDTKPKPHERAFSYISEDGVCATEIVRALKAGRQLQLDPVEVGAYRLEIEQRARRDSKEERSRVARCRCVFDLTRGEARLYRSLVYERAV